MERKHRLIGTIVILITLFAVRWCQYNLPVNPPLLDEVNEDCYVTVLPVYKGLEQDNQLKTLTKEEILELKEFLQDSTFCRMHRKDKIRIDSDTTYRITITWSDGKRVQIRTFGENIYGSDTVAWDGNKLLLLKTYDENWHIELEKLLME